MRPSLYSDAESIEELVRSEEAAPLPEELEVLRAAVRIADTRLSLPDKITVLWRLHSSVDAALGACRGTQVYLAIGPHIGLELLGRTALHELRHVHDFAMGLSSGADAERRAESFALEMLPYLRSGSLPPASPPATTRAPATKKPTSIRPRPPSRAAAVDTITRELKVRVSRLQRHVDPLDRRDLGAVLALLERLTFLARQGKGS